MNGFVLQKDSVFFVGGDKKLAMLRSLFDLARKAFSLCQNKTLLLGTLSYLDVRSGG